MPRYRVEALEKFTVRTRYLVDAQSPQQAEAACRQGQVPYDKSSIEEGGEAWIETVSVEEVDE